MLIPKNAKRVESKSFTHLIFKNKSQLKNFVEDNKEVFRFVSHSSSKHDDGYHIVF